MRGTKFVKAYCARTGKRFGLEVAQFGGQWKVVNMVELTDEEASLIASEVKQPSFETNKNLLPCSRCGGRRVGGCACAKAKGGCSKGMKYRFDCVYCNEFTVDYSLPSRFATARRAGETMTLSQGKEVRIVTFSNVEWTKFDNVSVHADAGPYVRIEPKVHVIANEKNIEFHGYNVSQMDEGVYYIIGRGDDFDIECNVDTSTILPHPGGCFYIDFGLIKAEVTNRGGSFWLDGHRIADVMTRFKMRLSLENGCYTVWLDGRKYGEKSTQYAGEVKVIFGFKHDSHYCELLSHAYLREIQMQQGVGPQGSGQGPSGAQQGGAQQGGGNQKRWFGKRQ